MRFRPEQTIQRLFARLQLVIRLLLAATIAEPPGFVTGAGRTVPGLILATSIASIPRPVSFNTMLRFGCAGADFGPVDSGGHPDDARRMPIGTSLCFSAKQLGL